jgi:CDP-diacylglycerol---glycerol-3-phosphate 3-phosphatidyltransferase
MGMGIYAIKPKFQKTLLPIKRLFIRLGISPTVVNFLGLVCSLIIATSIAHSVDINWFLLVVPFFAFFRTALNALDGMIAREQNLSSSKGELLNEFLDRLSDIIVFSSFALLLPDYGFLVAVTTSLVILSSFVGVLNKAFGGVRLYTGVMGKADRMLYLGLAAVLQFFFEIKSFWVCFLYFLMIGMILTIASRVRHILKQDESK